MGGERDSAIKNSKKTTEATSFSLFFSFCPFPHNTTVSGYVCVLLYCYGRVGEERWREERGGGVKVEGDSEGLISFFYYCLFDV
jgi:hypothetical protein